MERRAGVQHRSQISQKLKKILETGRSWRNPNEKSDRLFHPGHNNPILRPGDLAPWRSGVGKSGTAHHPGMLLPGKNVISPRTVQRCCIVPRMEVSIKLLTLWTGWHFLLPISTIVMNRLRYYGYYSNQARGDRKKSSRDDIIPKLMDRMLPASSSSVTKQGSSRRYAMPQAPNPDEDHRRYRGWCSDQKDSTAGAMGNKRAWRARAVVASSRVDLR